MHHRFFFETAQSPGDKFPGGSKHRKFALRTKLVAMQEIKIKEKNATKKRLQIGNKELTRWIAKEKDFIELAMKAISGSCVGKNVKTKFDQWRNANAPKQSRRLSKRHNPFTTLFIVCTGHNVLKFMIT